MIKWTKKKEQQLLKLRDTGKSYADIADELGITIGSAKHKYIRLMQVRNESKYHHPIEKTEQILKYVDFSKVKRVYETFAGHGNLSTIYAKYAKVVGIDNNKTKVDFCNSIRGVTCIKDDSYRNIYKQILDGKRYDLIDIDGYCYPSRFFPHIFLLLNKGYLIFTFPKIGVQKCHAVYKLHYATFYGIHDTLAPYKDKVVEAVQRYGMMNFRVAKLINYTRIDRIDRFIFWVERKSSLDITGLKVKGINY